ncbi:MAG TPA: hypothetical protein VF508_03025 [Pyrinomonadaceae bacterium]|jgi:hypothetical protein
MAEGDRTNNDAADAGTEGVREGGNRTGGAAGAEAAGGDPAGFESLGVGDPRQQQQGGGQGEGEGGGQPGRAGDWNPGEHSGGGGELY